MAKFLVSISLPIGYGKLFICFSWHFFPSNLLQCPPCRAFTPGLVTTYNKIKADGKNFEVIFVTSDRSEDSFEGYYETMTWLAIPYGDSRIAALKEKFGISGKFYCPVKISH
jgi:hypothetical protein